MIGKLLPALTFCLLSLPACPSAESSPDRQNCKVIDDFSEGISSGWDSRSFKGLTEYTWKKEGDRGFVRATSKSTASGLYYRIKFDPQKYPYLTWQWQVDNIIPGGDASKKSGDDYPARIYVVFPSFFFWNTRAINYIWANRLPKGESVPNPFTANAMMISIESGPDLTGKWLTETRNIYEDYKRSFGEEPPEVGAIAIMTDSDNTGESAAANYGTIAICRSRTGE